MEVAPLEDPHALLDETIDDIDMVPVGDREDIGGAEIIHPPLGPDIDMEYGDDEGSQGDDDAAEPPEEEEEEEGGDAEDRLEDSAPPANHDGDLEDMSGEENEGDEELGGDGDGDGDGPAPDAEFPGGRVKFSLNGELDLGYCKNTRTPPYCLRTSVVPLWLGGNGAAGPFVISPLPFFSLSSVSDEQENCTAHSTEAE